MKLLIVVIPLFLLAQGNYSFGPSIRVNEDSPGTCDRTCSQRSIVCRGDTIFLVWEDSRYGTFRVFFSKSTDSGVTWSANMVISQNVAGYDCGRPHMCLDVSSNILVAYGCIDTGSNADIYLVRSTNGGSTFSTPVLVNDSSVVFAQYYPAIAVDSSGQYVYIVWQDWRNPQYDSDIYFARSTNSGASFLPAVRVNDDSVLTNQWFPVIACDNLGQNIYVVWEDPRDTLHGGDVYFSRSTNYGQTFEPNYPVNDTGVSGNSTQRTPSICWRKGIVYLTWDDLRQNCMGAYFDKSVDSGVTFGTDVFIVDTPNIGGAYPSIAVGDLCKIYVVWKDDRQFDPYGSDIYFSFSNDSGQTFKPNVQVNDHLGNLNAIDDNPSTCANDSGRIFVAWDSDRNDQQWGYEDIYCAVGNYLGIQEFFESNLSPNVLHCFPNPFSKYLNIIIESNQSTKNLVLKIYDVTGRMIKQFNHLTNYQFNQIVWFGDDQQGRDVPAGVYIVGLVNNGKSFSKKIIKIGGMK